MVGLDKRIWQVKEVGQGIELNYLSPHLEEGFPANIEFTVRYLLDKNKLTIEYVAQPDRETIINLTNHTYFNLSGAVKKDISGHQLQIKANKFLCLNQDSIPTGEIKRVEGTPFDFRRLKKVGEEIEADNEQLKFTGGYDHPFILDEEDESIILKEEESGRVLSISTDQPVVVFYSGNHFTAEASGERLGLCLETQDYPNAINTANFPTKVYNSEKSYIAKTEYKFDVK